MARVKDQAARRAEIVRAAKRAIAARGLTGLRLKDVAAESDLTAGAVAYYYPDLAELVYEVHRDAVERFYWDRRRALDEIDDPRIKLTCTVTGGVPSSRRDIDFQVLNELHVHAYRDEVHARLMAELFDREVSLYEGVLLDGVAAGAFALKAPVGTIARNLVALEDAYGLHVLGGSRIDAVQVRQMILTHAAVLVGCDLG